MDGLPGLGLGEVAPRKRGRPKGAVGKRSGDLRAYIEAMYGGLTPGQAAAAIGLPTVKELRQAKGDLVAALATKAGDLAVRLGISQAEAWVLMAKERETLMAYVHQRLAQVDVTSKGEQLLPMIIMPDQPAQQLQGVIDLDDWQVSPLKSHDEAEP